MAPAPCTVTDAAVLPTLGLVAVMVTDPVVSPATENVVEEDPAANETEAGIETMPA